MKTIDEQGNEQVWTAHYWRHYAKYQHEASSLEDAIRFLSRGEEDGVLSSDSVTGPNGEVVLADKDACWAAENLLDDAAKGRTLTVRELAGGAS